MTQFKVLSPEKIKAVGFDWMAEYKEELECYLEAQHKDTLRQVVEMLDGIENPYLRRGMMKSYQYDGFDKAIQTIKQAIEEG